MIGATGRALTDPVPVINHQQAAHDRRHFEESALRERVEKMRKEAGDLVAKAKALHEKGMSWRDIGTELHIDGMRAHALIDDDYAKHYLTRRNKARAKRWKERKA